MTSRQIAVAAVMRRENEILLVQQQTPAQSEPSWALPGGMIEPGELLVDGLTREVGEETGLELTDPGSLLYVAQCEGPQESGIAFIFDVGGWTGDLMPRDPDGYILDARFLPVRDAIYRLETLPWRIMREPILACLRERIEAGTLWSYREDHDGEQALIGFLPGMIVDR